MVSVLFLRTKVALFTYNENVLVSLKGFLKLIISLLSGFKVNGPRGPGTLHVPIRGKLKRKLNIKYVDIKIKGKPGKV